MAATAAARERTRVVVVDDQALVRLGLRTILLAADDLEVVGEAADGEEALRVCAAAQPQIVLMDVRMPRLDGLAALRELRRRDPTIRVLVLTTYPEDHLVREAVQAGASGYLLKEVQGEELLAAIRAARVGQPSYSPAATEALARLVAGTTGITPGREQANLTEREREVLALLVQGLGTRRIADRLVITPATVKYHVQHLFAKLGVASRTQLVSVALQHHLVE
jgi:DNA-binding NarL/FixJ family response regulator